MDLSPLTVPETEVYVFNPTRDDFTDTILGNVYLVKAGEGVRMPKDHADLVATHLKDLIVGRISGVITDVIIEKTLKMIYL